MAVEKQIATIEEFLQFALIPENSDRDFEFINRKIVEKLPGTTRNSELAQIIMVEARLFCGSHEIPCHTSGANGSYRIGGHILVPDFAYKRTPMSSDYPDPVAPEWVVEIISPTDKVVDIRKKRTIYRAAGILLWEVYPRDRSVHVYAPDLPLRVYGVRDTLDVGDLMPGFHAPSL